MSYVETCSVDGILHFCIVLFYFFFSSRRRHTRCSRDWSSDVCSSDLNALFVGLARAVKIPARDVYGARCADSAEFKSLGKGGDISKAQHCRAEFYLNGYGWVPVDPADVRKVILEEGGGLPAGLADPKAQRARAKLFGAWEVNWLPYHYGHDLPLADSAAGAGAVPRD